MQQGSGILMTFPIQGDGGLLQVHHSLSWGGCERARLCGSPCSLLVWRRLPHLPRFPQGLCADGIGRCFKSISLFWKS